MRVRVCLALLLVACARSSGVALFEDEFLAQMKATGLREPVLVASVVGDAYWPSVSPDGSLVVFTATQNGTVDVWKKVLATGETIRLTSHSADDEDPAISPDGEHIAFISRKDDAKGDVYIMDTDGGGEIRITDEKTGDRAPAWAPDGKSLLISTRVTPDADEDVFRFDLKTKVSERLTEGGGFDASLDASGTFIVYSQRLKTADGRTTTRIVAKRLRDKKIVPLGDGRRPEAFARIAQDDGKTWVYFTRYVEDDNQDGRIDVLDLPSLYRVPVRPELFDGGSAADYSEPVTSGYSSETLAAISGKKLFFVASGPGGLEIQTLPLDGLTPHGMSAPDIFALADGDIPGRMRRYLFRVVMARGGPDALRARYELARDFAGENRLEDAQTAFERVIELAGGTTPIGRLARLEQLRNQFFLTQKERRDTQNALQALKDRVKEVAPPEGSKLVSARANVVLAEAAEYLGAYSMGLGYAQAVPREGDEYSEDAVRAMRVEATIGSIALPAEDEQRRLVQLVRERPRQVREAKVARARFFELMPKDPREKLAAIDRLLPGCKGLGALEVALVLAQGEVLVELEQPALAVLELQKMQARKDLATNDRGRVLFALAKTQELLGDLGAALQSFEALMSGGQFNRTQRNRARVELLRLALKKAQADEAKGDLGAAYEAYRTLAKNNFSEAGAHRKVLQLGELIGLAQDLAKEYRQKAKEMPYDRVAQYANALAATYVNDLSEAEQGFEKALDLDASFAYAHMGLGWALEQKEYRRPGASDALERALFEYQTALSLFEVARETDATAEAALNLGNAFLRLGQFEQAFHYYVLRELARTRFGSSAQQIVFRERFGQAAVRTGQYDVALMQLKDGIRLAEKEGDDRRLGRMRALLALTYDALEMPAESRASLVRARDEYATRGDFNRVVAIDRTIGWLSLADGDEAEAVAALERSLDLIKKGYGPEGFRFGFTLTPLGTVTALAVDGTNASRAPFGFSVSDEEEILESLLGRIFSRLGDTEVAAQYLERRLKTLTKTLEDSKIGDFINPEWYEASAELMLLAVRRGDVARANELFIAASERYAKSEAPALKWLVPVLRVLPRLTLVALTNEQRKAHDKALAQMQSAIAAGPKKDGKAASQPAEEATDEDRLRVEVLAQMERVSKQQAVLTAEHAANATLAADPKAAADAISALVTAIDAQVAQPAKAASAPASQPVVQIVSRPAAQQRVQALFDAADQAAIEARSADAEAAFAEIAALAKRFSLFEAAWQTEYARFRLGPAAQRAQALARAEKEVKDADVLARLLYPERPRPALWHGLMRALLAAAVESKKPERVAEVLERMSIESIALPDGLARPDLSGAEAARASLTAWAQKTLAAMRNMRKRATERQEKALKDLVDKGLADARAVVEPWQTLLWCKLTSKQIADLAAALEGGDGFEWAVPGHDVKLTLAGKALALVPRDAPASQPASLATGKGTPVLYVAGASSAPNVARVASASALWLAILARNSNEDQPLDFQYASETKTKLTAGAVPADAAAVRGPAARSEELAVQTKKLGRSVVRFVLSLDPYGGAPGVFRFSVAGENSWERRLTSLTLPMLSIHANLAIVDGLETLDQRLLGDVARAFALAGTPAMLACAPEDADAHARLMQRFYAARAGQRAAEAWSSAALSEPKAAARCEYWGFANDGADARKKFAETRLDEIAKLAGEESRKKNVVAARELYQQALDFATYLDKSERALVFRFSLATMNSLLAAQSPDNARALYEEAITKYAEPVVEQWKAIVAKTPEKRKDLAAARNLLGIICYKAAQFEKAAQIFEAAAADFGAIGSKENEATALLQRGTALVDAGKYQEAIASYQKSADIFGAAGKVPSQITALRNAGTRQESSLSEFLAALATFTKVRQLADSVRDKAGQKDRFLMARSRIDLARVQRQLASYEDARATIREVFDFLDPKDVLIRAEATLELARIYWLSNDYDRAFNAAVAAERLADKIGQKDSEGDRKQSSYLNIQSLSAQGLILMSQGKRVAASNRLRRALKKSRDRDFPRRAEESNQLNNFGFTLRERGMLDAAGRMIQKAVAIDTELKSKDGLAFDFRNLAAIRLREGDLQEAKQYLGQAIELNTRVGNRYNAMNIALVEGEIALVEKRTADCQRAFEAAVAEAVKLKSKDIEWKARLGLALNILANKPKERTAAQKELETALAIVEALGPKLEDVRSDEERVNELTMARLQATLAQMYVDDKDVAGVWRLLERLRLKELRDQISTYTWTVRLGVASDDANDYAKLLAAARKRNDTDLVPLLTLEPVTIKELQRRRPKDAIIALRAFERGVVAVIADERGERTKLVPMDRAQIIDASDQWIDAVDHLQPPPPAADKLHAALAQLFDEPVLKRGRVLVVADATFMRLPWAALPIGGAPLIERAALSFEISGTHAALVTGEPRQAAGPVITVGPLPSDELPFAELEIAETGALFRERGTPVVNKSLEAFYTSTEDPARLWHIALHGHSISRSMEGSFLRSGDQPLWAVELLEARRDVPTVVLSACHRPGSAPDGVEFVSALRLSGTDRVILPASRIFDDQGALFVKHVVRLLAEDGDVERLRALQRDAYKRGEPASVWANWQWYGKVE
ncbi:MAG: PD40 domain-containing protein [Deltaproteobacteria bacterium]|nr:PD40 domain-containing protein [Deltaproteobacteria bacterium]